MKLLKSFLAVSILGIAALSASESPATVHIQDAQGTTVNVEADGTKTIKEPNGTIVEVKPDGSKMVKRIRIY